MGKYIITFGGESCEHDISVITAFSVYNAICRQYNIMLIYMKNGKFYYSKKCNKIADYVNFNKNKFDEVYFSCGKMKFASKLRKEENIDCAIVCNHGGNGENGVLSGYFELAQIPYTAPGAFTCSLFMDKVHSKAFFISKRIPSVPYRVYTCGTPYETLECLGYPLILKPANLGSSVGISIANNREELREKLDFALLFDKKILVEKALINFIELNCAAYFSDGNIIVSEIEKPIYRADYYDFETKYEGGNEVDRELPANIDSKLAAKIYRLTKEIYSTSGAKGVIRVDYLLCDDKLYASEVNAIPGSLAFYLFKNKGINMKELIFDLIVEAKKQAEEQRKLTCDFSSDVLKNFDSKKLDFGVKK